MIKNIKLFFILFVIKRQVSSIKLELKKYSFEDFDWKNTNISKDLNSELFFYKKILKKELNRFKNISIKKQTKVTNMLKLIQDHIDYINYKE